MLKLSTVYSTFKIIRSTHRDLVCNRLDGFVIQIRLKSSLPPPAGVTPVTPKGIPYARPGLRPERGGNILLLIPLITFGLGTWQIKRLKWKTDLIEAISSKKAMDPVPLPLDLEDVSQMEFQKVIVTGTFDHEKECYYGPKPCLVNGEPNPQVLSKTGEGSYGYNLITPFIISESGQRILVNRGWIATKTLKPEKRPWSKTEGEQTIIGTIRTTEPQGSIGPSGNPQYKVWHYRNIPEMAAKYNCSPIYIDATEEHSIPNCLWAGQTRTNLRNEHLSYILTWYSLSAATTFMWYSRYIKK